MDGEKKLQDVDQREQEEWDIWNLLLEEQKMVLEQEHKHNQKLRVLRKNDYLAFLTVH